MLADEAAVDPYLEHAGAARAIEQFELVGLRIARREAAAVPHVAVVEAVVAHRQRRLAPFGHGPGLRRRWAAVRLNPGAVVKTGRRFHAVHAPGPGRAGQVRQAHGVRPLQARGAHAAIGLARERQILAIEAGALECRPPDLDARIRVDIAAQRQCAASQRGRTHQRWRELQRAAGAGVLGPEAHAGLFVGQQEQQRRAATARNAYPRQAVVHVVQHQVPLGRIPARLHGPGQDLDLRRARIAQHRLAGHAVPPVQQRDIAFAVAQVRLQFGRRVHQALALHVVGRQQHARILAADARGDRVVAVARGKLDAEALFALTVGRIVGREHDMRAQAPVDVVIDLHLAALRGQRWPLVHLGQHGFGGLDEHALLLEGVGLLAQAAVFRDSCAIVVRGVHDRPGQPAPGRAAEGHVDVVDRDPVDQVGAVEHPLVALALALGGAGIGAVRAPVVEPAAAQFRREAGRTGRGQRAGARAWRGIDAPVRGLVGARRVGVHVAAAARIAVKRIHVGRAGIGPGRRRILRRPVGQAPG